MDSGKQPAAEIDHWTQALAETWGLTGTLRRLGGEYDRNFVLEGPRSAVLKVMREGCERDFVDMQARLHAHVGKRPRDVPVPDILPALSGDIVVELNDETGRPRLVWVIERLPGKDLGHTRPRTPALYRTLGAAVAGLAEALADFDHPLLERPLKWDLRRGGWIKEHLGLIGDDKRRRFLEAVCHGFEDRGKPLLERLPVQAIHNDLNDFNLLASGSVETGVSLSGIIDFGDAIKAPVLCDLAIAGAYAILDTDEPLASLGELVSGFCERRPLSAEEADALWALVLMRLAVSVVNAAIGKQSRPDDPYVTISERPAWQALDWARDQDAAIVRACVRGAAGLTPIPEIVGLADAIREARPGPVFDADLGSARVVDLSVAGHEAPLNPESIDAGDFDPCMQPAATSAIPAIGRYGEARLIYTEPMFRTGNHPAPDRRTIHLGIDIFVPDGTAVHAPFDGKVIYTERSSARQDYGSMIVLEHRLPDGSTFHALYGHLSTDSLTEMEPGRTFERGQAFAKIGVAGENGGWPPHLHVQIGAPSDPAQSWPGVFPPALEHAARSVYPNPAALLGLDEGRVAETPVDASAERTRRARHFPSNLKLSYREPITVLRGWRNTIFDDRGRPYLDAYNNVPHVGHANPRVAEAVSRQLRLINTNTRYLQPIAQDYAEAISALLPEGLDVVFFVNSGSEANDIAVRLARTYTGASDVVVSRSGYHGITQSAIDISEYKFGGPRGKGKPDHVRVAELPDTYRGRFKAIDPDAGPKYAADVERCIQQAESAGRRVAAFISEPFPSVGGQIVPPPGYLKAVYDHVHAHEGLCIADEVQTGLGRLGRYRWGFEQQGAHPDIVVLGKPVANGHPLGVVITTREIADAFAEGPEYFSTFGGSTVSCASGLAVLRELEDAELPSQVARVGDHLLDGLRRLANIYPSIGDVRGLGLFLGVEMIEPDGAPATAAAGYIVNRLREQRILIGSDGPHDNVLKIRPPLTFSIKDADLLLGRLLGILDETPLDRINRRD